MSESGLWRRLDTPGHDAAFLARDGNGWSLRGMAVFGHERGPACVSYSVDLDSGWRTKCGRLHGHLAGEPIDHFIERRADGWYLNGALVDGLKHLVDLDYGFTPATNLTHLRRVAPAEGETADIAVVWFDIDVPTLTELPQRYERRSASTYWYQSPQGGYQALLEMAPNGFTRHYPDLWVMEV